jgi:hypothetical protein
VQILGGAAAGAVIGGVAGGVSYALRNPGKSLGEYVRDTEFRKAVGIGAASGAVAGVVATAVPLGLAALGLKAATAGGAAFIGWVGGSLAGAAGQVTHNLLTPCTKWHQGVSRAMFWGGLGGAAFGWTGWHVRQWWLSRSTSPGINLRDIAGRSPDEIDTIARRSRLVPKGPNPQMGQGAYINPVTGEQRMLVHPFDTVCGPHCHMNNPTGQRLDINGNVVSPSSPDAHLPIQWP